MIITDPSRSEPHLLLERHLEHWGLGVCKPLAFLDVLKLFRIAPTMPVTAPSGIEVSLRAIDVFAARRKYLARLDLGQQICTLALLGATLITQFQDWLTTDYSPRYQWLTTDTQRAWLSQVAQLVVVRSVLEDKCTRFLTEGRQTFADSWVCFLMCRLDLEHRLPGEQARLVHHIVRDPAQQQALLQQFFEDLDVRMQRHPFVLLEPLPPLPEGTPLPFPLLPLFKEEQLGARRRTPLSSSESD